MADGFGLFNDPYTAQMLGLGLLANSGPSPYRKGLGEVFGTAGLNAMQLAQQRQLAMMKQKLLERQAAMREKLIDKQVEAMEKSLKRQEKMEKLRDKLADRVASSLTAAQGPFSDEQAAMLMEQTGELLNPAALGGTLLQGGIGLGDPNLLRSGLGLLGGPEEIETRDIGGLGKLAYTRNALGQVKPLYGFRAPAVDPLQQYMLEMMKRQQQEQEQAQKAKPESHKFSDFISDVGDWFKRLTEPEPAPQIVITPEMKQQALENTEPTALPKVLNELPEKLKEKGEELQKGLGSITEKIGKREAAKSVDYLLTETNPWALRTYWRVMRPYLPPEVNELVRKRLQKLEQNK